MKDDSGLGIVMLIVWLLTTLSLEPTTHPYSVAYAEEVCATNGGWARIEEGYGFFSSVKCKNGAEFDYDWTELDKKSREPSK